MSGFGGGRIIQSGLVWCMDWEDRQSWVSGSDYWYDKVNNAKFDAQVSHSQFDTEDRIIFDGTHPTQIRNSTNGPITQATTDFTLQYWWRRDGSAGGGTIPTDAYHQMITGVNGNLFWVSVVNSGGSINRITMRMDVTGTGSYYPTALDPFPVSHPNGTWRHHTITLSSTEGIKMYVDGNIRVENPDTCAHVKQVDNGSGVTYFGRDNAYVPNGAIGQVLFYDRVLSDEEIYENYLSTRGRFGK